MGLDQYASIKIVVPENESAIFPPILIQKLQTALFNQHFQQQSDWCKLADELTIPNESLARVLNAHDNSYAVPVFQVEYSDDDYLARNYWDLNKFIMRINKPKLKDEDQTRIGTDYIRNTNDFVNGAYDLDITKNIDKIIQWIPEYQSSAKTLLIGLYSYQSVLQSVINQYQTNLNAIVAYHIWF